MDLVKWVSNNKIAFLAVLFLIYLLIAMVNFYPILFNIKTTIAGYGGDPYQMLWHLWWVPYAIFTLHTSIWQTNMVFWPVGANLVYETMIPLAALLVAPFQVISLAFAYNMLFFLGFALSGVGMFVLAKYITNDNYAAFIAGVIFSFSAFHIAQSYGHLQYANIEWVPISIYFLLKIIKEDKNRYRNALLLAVTFTLLLFMVGIEQGLMVLLLMILIVILYAVSKPNRNRVINLKFWYAIGIFIIATLILGIWAFIPTISTLVHNGIGTANYLNDVSHNILWSNDILSFFLPSYFNGIFHGLSASYLQIYHQDPQETTAYVGYTVIILSLIGIFTRFKESRIWIAIGVISALLSLGPILLVNGNLTSIPMPFALYRLIPIINIIREPGRFDMIVTLATAILAALGLKTVFEFLNKHGAQNIKHSYALISVFAIVFILIFIESNGMPLSRAFTNSITTYTQIPGLYKEISSASNKNISVLELPAIPDNSSSPELYPAQAMFYQTVSHIPIVGGYTTRENITQELSVYQIPLAAQTLSLEDYGDMNYPSPVYENYTNETLLALFNYDTGFVILNKDAFNSNSLSSIENYLYGIFGSPIYNDNTTIAFDTAAAINRTIYRSFVAYPILTEWEGVEVPFNGSLEDFWIPQNNSEVVVYAPYKSDNASAKVITIGSNPEFVNATIRFYAFSYSGSPGGFSVIRIYKEGSWISGGYSEIAELNITPSEELYQVNTSLISGPEGTELLFIQNSQSDSEVLIRNITISCNTNCTGGIP